MNIAWIAAPRGRTPRRPSWSARWSPWLLAVSVALAGCAGGSSSPQAAEPTGSVAFYAFDGTLPGRAGALLRSEPLPPALGLSDAGRQFRILYTSTDGASGQAMRVTSGAVFYPAAPVPGGGWPIIAWAHGTVGIGDGCAPSRNPRTARDSAYLNAWLREGYAVVATDYQGLGTAGPHLYLHARAQAYSILDSVRAALGGLPDLANRVVLLGQSQGGGAVFATAGFAPAYAPELDVRGTVASGTPHLARQNAPTFPPQRVNPTLAYVMYATRTAQVFDPALKDSDVFTDRALPVLAQSDTLCVGPLESAVVQAGLTNANALMPTGPAQLFARLGTGVAYPTLKLTQPLFMATGERDVDVSAEQQVALARDACNAGSRVEQHVYPGLDHSATVNASLADSVPFVRRVLAGRDIASTCAARP